MSTIYLYNQDFEGCTLILKNAYPIIQKLHRYDYLAIFWVRVGICHSNKKLIDKGANILQLVGEKDLLKKLDDDVDQFFEEL